MQGQQQQLPDAGSLIERTALHGVSEVAGDAHSQLLLSSWRHDGLTAYRVLKSRTALDKTIWTEVAVCWPHKDGNGWNVKFKFNEAPATGAEYVMRRDTRRSPPVEA